MNAGMTSVATQASSSADVGQLPLWSPSSSFRDITSLLASLPLRWKKSMVAKPFRNKRKVEMSK